jgi:hypothetical protein
MISFQHSHISTPLGAYLYLFFLQNSFSFKNFKNSSFATWSSLLVSGSLLWERPRGPWIYYTDINAHGNICRSGEISKEQLCSFLQSIEKKSHKMHGYFTTYIGHVKNHREKNSIKQGNLWKISRKILKFWKIY